MKFKLSVEFLIVVFLFVSIMIVSTYGSTKIMPYEQKSAKLPMFKYEGFEGEGEGEGEEEKKEEEPSNEGFKDNVKPNSIEQPWARVKNGPDKPLDIMSQQKTDSSCLNISTGLSKSTGYLCPTEEVQELQRTRGRNSSGVPHQIGA